MTTQTKVPLKTFQFFRVQGGYWGTTILHRTINVKAVDLEEALIIVSQRADYYKRLKNGDWESWRTDEWLK
jgi:hypothetical protein